MTDAWRDENFRRTDRLFVGLMLGQWAFAVLLAIVVSPYSWAGKTHVIHAHVYIAGALRRTRLGLPIALGTLRPGWIGTRMVIAAAQMLWSALLIH